jgi:hypothetical protein
MCPGEMKLFKVLKAQNVIVEKIIFKDLNVLSRVHQT